MISGIVLTRCFFSFLLSLSFAFPSWAVDSFTNELELNTESDELTFDQDQLESEVGQVLSRIETVLKKNKNDVEASLVTKKQINQALIQSLRFKDDMGRTIFTARKANRLIRRVQKNIADSDSSSMMSNDPEFIFTKNVLGRVDLSSTQKIELLYEHKMVGMVDHLYGYVQSKGSIRQAIYELMQKMKDQNELRPVVKSSKEKRGPVRGIAVSNEFRWALEDVIEDIRWGLSVGLLVLLCISPLILLIVGMVIFPVIATTPVLLTASVIAAIALTPLTSLLAFIIAYESGM